jgi:GTPase SAR1 family protein
VGKTSLIEAYTYEKISNSSKPTIGAEFTKRKVVLGTFPDDKLKG